MAFEIGSRINCILHYCGEGIVYAIHGEQRPESVETLGGFIQRGGSATFDVVFLNGSVSKNLPEAVILGVQWSKLEGVATAEEIAEALAHSACVKAAKASAADMAARRYADAVDALKVDPAFKRLVQDEDTHSGKLAARNIRTQLKAAFPGVKFSVTKRSYGALNVEWLDGPTPEAVAQITGPYVSGSFDGMEDLYTSHVTPWNAVFGGAKYIFDRRETSDALTQAAIDEVFNTHGGLDGIEKPTPANLGRNYTPVPGYAYELSTLVRIQAAKMEGAPCAS
ncbi:hypothetical protein HTK96_13910 [Brevundimonas vesicularis]|uniref:LPD29 domain-containing protein n=1 Tax=Brevundimonas vesicularis TaxID=41276 RepID=UPI0015734918|nr:LPD29 domain-containing protein [Brevundimonas vesicularis]NSX34469.1 hypothetical protein [Brevundimonas vesicularis]